MQKLSIADIATACQARPNDVRSALAVCGRRTTGDWCFLPGPPFLNEALFNEINRAKAMNAAQAQRHASK